MMEARRRLLMQLKSEGVGIFTKGYEAILTPQSNTLFTVTHNLGILPRFVIIEADMDTIKATNYVKALIIDNDVYGLQNECTGCTAGMYHYDNTDSYASRYLPVTSYEATETVLSIPASAIYSNGRSPWDTAANYSVRIWG